MARIKGWTTLRAPALWAAWRAQFGSDDEAAATAIWIANRTVKDKARSSKRKFYSVKDEFIRRNLARAEGQRARLETQPCWCGGEPDCWKCDGTGVYRSRWLYVHRFQVAGQAYSFHSYVEPLRLLDGQAEDAERYGGTFSEAELAALALPFSGLLKLLGYVAAGLWGMHWAGDSYVSADAVQQALARARESDEDQIPF